MQQQDPSTPLTGVGEIKPRANAHYWRLKLQSTENSYYWQRLLTFPESATSEGNFDSHGGTPHYLIGCILDHRHRQQPMINNGTPGNRTLSTGDADFNTSWPGTTNPDNQEAKRWHFEQARLTSIRGTSTTRPQVVYQFCVFSNCNSDAISVNENVIARAEDCYAAQVRRGFLVQNGGNSTIVALRCEAEGEYPSGASSAPLVETGLSDIEPFTNGAGGTGRQTDFSAHDCWFTSDWDAQPEGPNSGTGGVMDLSNVHMTKSSFVMWTPVGSHGRAIKSWTTKGSTVRYSVDQGGASTGSVLRGARVSDGVIVLEDILFIACGNFLHFHGVYRNWTTGNVFAFWHDPAWQGSVGPLTRIIYRRCRWETENLPAGISSSNVYCIRSSTVPAVGEDVEFDACTVANAFAQDRPFQWAGQRIFLTNGGVVRDNGRANGDLFQGSHTLG